MANGNYVNDVDSSFWQTFGPVVPPATYNVDPEADGNFLVDLRGMSRVTFFMRNSGAGALNWKLSGSIDGGDTFEIAELTTTNVGAAAVSDYWWTNWVDSGGHVYTHMLIQTELATGIATVKVSGT